MDHAPAIDDSPTEAEADVEAVWPATILSFSGAVIDVSTDFWRVGVDQTANLSQFRSNRVIFERVRFYLGQLLRTRSPDYVSGNAEWLSPLGNKPVAASVERSISETGYLDFDVYKKFSDNLKGGKVSRVAAKSAYIRWYLRCCDLGFDEFNEDVAIELSNIVLPRVAKGQAVLSEDPQSGPLSQIEIENLLAAMRYALKDGNLDKARTAMAWLMIAFGMNAFNLRLLEEDDLKKRVSSKGAIIYVLQIPRIKKRHSQERTAFRSRSLDPQLGELLEAVIEENRRVAPKSDDDFVDTAGADTKLARPLFRTAKVRHSLVGTAFEKWSFRPQRHRPALALSYLVRELDIKAKDGSQLHLTPRRLRYTLATRMVEGGASPREVADALDHSSTEHVLVYFNSRFDLVAKVDKAIGPYLITHAQAFMGRIVKGPEEAVRGDDPSSEIALVSASIEGIRRVGTCGDLGYCDLHSPIACYTCRDFQAWIEADHRAVLETLIAKREGRLTGGAFIKLTKVHDRTIAAIKEVIRRCDEVLSSRFA